MKKDNGSSKADKNKQKTKSQEASLEGIEELSPKKKRGEEEESKKRKKEE